MTSTQLRRVVNLAAWLGAAIFVQAGIIALLAVTRPDPAYGVYGTLFFAGLFNVIGTVCGLVGYALAASALPSSASALASGLAGAIWVLTAMTLVWTTSLLPQSAQLAGAALLCLASGFASYLFANRSRGP